MWRRGGDWWRLRTRVVCSAAPADAPLGPPSEDTPSAGCGAAVATGEPGTPAPAGEPSAEAPPTAPADAPLGPLSGGTPSAGCGAAVATGEPGTPALAGAPSAEAPPANRGAAAAGAAHGAPLRERRLPVQRALTAAVEQRWPVSRSGFALWQRRCHSAAPGYRRLRAEPGPPAPRRRVSGSAPAPRIRLRAEPSRPLPRQHVSCSAPGSVMRPRFAAAGARYRRRAGRAAPPPRAPGAPPSRPTTCAGRGATADPSAGAVPVRTPGRWSPSRCSGWGPRRAACRAVAPPRERRRPAGRRPGACSCRRPARSARAGVAGAVAEPPAAGRATAPQTDPPGTIPARATRHAASLMEPRPARARAPTPAPAPGDASAAEVVEQGLRPRTARRVRQRERDHRRAPETARRCRSTLDAAAARRHARRRGPAQQSGSPPAPRARSPRPHHRNTRRPAVQAPAPIGARAPRAHPLRPALPAAQAAWFDRRCGALYGTGARPARRRQRWFPTAPPQSDSARRSAGWPAPTHASGTAASPGCAAARRRR